MSDGSRPAVRAWNPEQWRLRWKVTAVLAVPLIVALVLGGLRISDETAESRRSNEAAEHIDVVTAAIGLESLTGTVIGGQASGTLAPDDLSRLDEAIGNVQKVVDGADPGTAAALNSAVEVARTIRADGSASPAPLPELADRQHRIQADTVAVVESAVQDIEDSTVSAAKTQLVTTVYAQRGLFDQTIGAIALMRDPGASPKDVASGLFAEAAMVDTLSRTYANDDRRIADLRKGNANRTALVDQGIHAGVWPLLELRESLLDSLATYMTLLQNAAKTITGTVTDLADAAQRGAIRDVAVVLVALVAALALAVLVSRSLVAPIRRLREGALDIAEYELPDEVERIKLGDSVDDIRAEALPVHTTEEIGELARAVDDIHDQALRLAGEQAELRLQISEMFETLARRSKTLVDHQLTLIESMEFEEKDPQLLERLFRLDHLATRMRRNGDNLLVLAGTPPRKGKSAPVAVVDILRAAMSEVEDYRRVKLGATPDLAIAGTAASDVVHLLSELLDNALRASPPASDVTFSFARAQDGGLVIEVSDRGVGISADEMDELNDRLARPAEVGPETARRMGLFVVGRLAERHGLQVRMRTTFESAADPGVTV
ncbi:MAG: sensor histidine kinase, partial [Aldersonia sp.]|nr:sensor histidine kinase [Aldersonia sp.]